MAVTGSEIVEVAMTVDAARRLMDEIKADAEEFEDKALALAQKALRFREACAWKLLGYQSWGDCCRVELGRSRQRINQLVDRLTVVDHLEPGQIHAASLTTRVVRPGDKVTRELVKILRSDGAAEMNATLREAKAEHGPTPTPQQVREVRRRRTEPPEPRPAPKPAWAVELERLARVARDVSDDFELLSVLHRPVELRSRRPPRPHV